MANTAAGRRRLTTAALCAGCRGPRRTATNARYDVFGFAPAACGVGSDLVYYRLLFEPENDHVRHS